MSDIFGAASAQLKSELQQGAEVTPPNANDLEAAARRMRQENDAARLRQTAIETQGSNPDTAARAQRLGRDMGLPPAVVERNLPEVERQAELERLNGLSYDDYLANYLADPDNYRVARDDVNMLEEMSKAARAVGNVARAVPGGAVGGAGSAISGLGSGYDALTRNYVGRPIDAAMSALGLGSLQDYNTELPWWMVPTEILRRGGGAIKSIGRAIDPPQDEQNIATDIAGGVGQLGMQIATVILTGGQAAIPMLLAQGADQQAERLERQGKYGTPEGDAAIVAGAAVTALTEKYGLDFIMRKLPQAARDGIMRRLQDVAVSAGAEALQEVVEGILQNVVEYAYYNPDAEILQDFSREAIAAGGAAAVVRSVLLAASGGRASARQRQDSERAQQDSEALKRVNELAEQSKLRERNPDKFREFVRGLVEPERAVEIDAETAVELFQSEPDLTQFMTQDEAERVSREVALAREVGSDVRMPLSTFIGAFVGHPQFDMLAENVRLSDNAPTAREASMTPEDLERQVGLLREEVGTVARQQEVTRQIYDDIFAQLKAAAVDDLSATKYAAIFTARLRTRAERLGQDPLELYRQSRPEIRRKYDGPRLRLSRLGTPAEPEYVSPVMPAGLKRVLEDARKGIKLRQRSMSSFFARMGGIKDQGGELMAIMGTYRAMPGLVNNKTGRTLDRALETAVEEGYMPYGSTIAEFLDVLSDDVNKRAQNFGWSEDFEGKARQEAVDDLVNELDALGLTIRDSDAAIAQALGVEPEMASATLEDLEALDRMRFRGAEPAPLGPVEDPDARTLDQSVTLRSGAETLEKYGLEPGKKYNTREVAAALEARQRKKYGVIAEDDRSPEAMRKISGWMVEEVLFEVDLAKKNPGKSAVGWYSEKFQRALDNLGEAFPEFVDEQAFNADALPGVALLGTPKAAREFFTALMAITSDGAKVADNFRFASQVYEQFRQTGAVNSDVTFGGERNQSMRLNLANISQVLDKYGPEGMSQWLLQKETVSTLKQIAKAEGRDFSTAYKANMELPMAALVFGPKLGAFYANLMGDTGYLTMDRWWSRTFNRFRGTLLQAPTRQGLDRFKQLAVADRRLNTPPDQMSDDEALALTVDYVKSYEAKGYKNGTEIEKAANTLYKAAFVGLEDRPFNASDREFMVNTTKEAQKKLKRKGVDLTIADIQAVLWYYEKRLYGQMGARQTADVSYEDIAKRVIEGRSDNQDVRQPGRDDADVGEPGSEGGLDVASAPDSSEVAGDFTDEEFSAGRTLNQDGQSGRPEPGRDRGDGRSESGRLARLAGAPSVAGFSGPDPQLVAVAEQYARDNGFELRRQGEYVEIDEARARRIADAYENMQHAPQDPVVREAYDNLIRQTRAQYDALSAAGYQFWFLDLSQDASLSYASSPWNAMRDIRANKTMGVVATDEGFGTVNQFNPDANPMLADTGLQWPVGGTDGPLKPVLANDLFRAVHDAFGHGLEGAGFRARGEENAWQAHVRLFTGSAVGAITSETRGQNSWLNYGPYGEKNRTSKTEDTVFADQKTGLMPEWTWTEGRASDMAVGEARTLNQSARLPDTLEVDGVLRPTANSEGRPIHPTEEGVRNFWRWFGDSKVVDDQGRPLVVYHGTGNAEALSAFDPSFTGKGNDQLGSGFYFTNNPDEASSYTTAVTQGAALSGQRKLGGDASPGVLPVALSIRNPIVVSGSNLNNADINITQKQAFDILKRAPNIRDIDESPIGNWVDVWGAGKITDKMIREVASNYLGATLISLENDFFRNESTVFREALRDVLGYDGVMQDFGDGKKHFVAWFPTQIKSAIGNTGAFSRDDGRILAQRQETGPRGSIQFLPDGQTIINLTEKADLSTFLHEMSHAWLEEMKADARLPDAPAQIVEDWNRIAAYLGIDPNVDFIPTEAHETFARTGEAYFMEGKAPSLELASAFERFKRWIERIYNTIARLNVPINDEIRGVFDRMLAADDEIEAAKNQFQFNGLFALAKDAGMTEDEFRRYQDLAAKARLEAERKVYALLLAEERRAQREEYREARETITAEVEAQVKGEPVYQTIAMLARGEMPDGTTLDTPMKLDRAMVRASYGTGIGKRLPRGVMADNGVPPDLVAPMFGFTSGDEMIKAMEAAPPLQQEIRRRVQERLKAQFPNPVDDGRAAEEAIEALHNDAQMQVLEAEFKALQRLGAGKLVDAAVRRSGGQGQQAGQAMGPEARAEAALGAQRRAAEGKAARERVKVTVDSLRADRKAIERAADAVINDTTVNDLLNTQKWRRAERASANAVIDAVAGQDWPAAAWHQRQRIINAHMVRRSMEARKDIEKAIGRFDKYLSRKPGPIDPDYLERVRTILSAYQFGPQLSDRRRNLLELRAILDWQKALSEDEQARLDIPPEITAADDKTHYRDMTVGEFMALRDTVENLATVGRTKNRLLREQAERDLNRTAKMVAETILDNVKIVARRSREAVEKGAGYGIAKFKDQFFASHRKIESLVREFDGFQKLGPVWQALFKPLQDAQNTETRMSIEATEAIRKLFEGYPADARRTWRTKTTYYPEIGQSLSKATVMSIALNWGNEGNREAIRKGYKWSDDQVRAVLNQTLTESDWQFVQGVWDYIDSFWPQLAALEKRVKGTEPVKVEASPVRTPFGELRGGYYPLKYDPDLSERAFSFQVDKMAQNLMTGQVAKASTRTGAALERVGSGGMPVRLELDVMFEHVAEVIHDLSHREAILDVMRLLEHPEVKGAVLETKGPQFHRAMKDWVRDIAAGDVPALTWFDKVVQHLRGGMSIAAMGWKLTTALVQVTGFIQSAVMLPKGALLKSVAGFYGNPLAMSRKADFVFERSVEMRTRSKNLDRDIRDTLRKLGPEGKTDALKRSFFYLTGLMDMGVALPTWLAAYETGMDQFQGDEARAIDYADQVVRTTQSSGLQKDLASIQRGDPRMKMFTAFYSYFSATYNLMVEQGRGMKGARDMPRFVANMALLTIVPAVLSELLLGRGPDEDEEEPWWAWAGKVGLKFALSGFVGVRDVVNAMGSDFGYAGSPVGSAVESMVKLGKQIGQGEMDKGLARAAVDTAGPVLHLPSRQAWITAEGIYLWSEGHEITPFEMFVTRDPKKFR